MILSIIYLIFMLYGIGLIFTNFLPESKTFLERVLMRLGIGLGSFSIFAVIFNFFHIPLIWWVFLIFSLFGYFLNIKKIKKPVFKPLHKSNIFIYIVLILFGLTLFMHVKGAFAYPWLEDTDPWSHNVGIKYVSVKHTMYDPPYDWIIKDRTAYCDVYPCSYDTLLSLPYSISKNMIWTMKFFNALIVSLGVIFFYFMTKEFTGNKTIALLSTFVFAMIPSYLSHFIWAHALVVTIFFPLMYCICKMDKNRLWGIPSFLILASIPVIHPIQAIKLYVLVGIYCIVRIIKNKKWIIPFATIFLFAMFLSLSWWAPIMIKSGGARNIADQSLSDVTSESSFWDGIKVVFDPASGTATQAYTFSDFVIAKGGNFINNPIGWGILISFILMFGLVFFVFKKIKSIQPWLIITLLWFLITFLFVNSMTFHLPIGLMAFRIWMLMAIPVSIITGYTIYSLRIKQKYLTYAIWIILLGGIFWTSAVPKWQNNTAIWGTWFSQQSTDEMYGYANLPNLLPKGSRVFSISGFQGPLIAFDMDVCEWCEEEMKFGNEILEYSATDIHQWLKMHDFQFFILDGRAVRAHTTRYGDNASNILQEKIYEIQASKLFNVIYQNQGMVVLEVW